MLHSNAETFSLCAYQQWSQHAQVRGPVAQLTPWQACCQQLKWHSLLPAADQHALWEAQGAPETLHT